MEVKSIDLYGKPFLNWVIINDPIKLHTRMPENEAGFVYVMEGSCINYTETEDLHLSAGEAVLAKSGNSTFCTLETEGKSIYSAIVVKFHKEVLDKVYEYIPSPFLRQDHHDLILNSTSVESNPLIKEYIHNLIKYFENPDLISEELLAVKLNELIVLLLQSDNAPSVLGIMNNLFEEKTFEFKEVIKAHICSSLSIEELAQLTNLSLSSFKRKFKEVYNDTPNRYLINQRIEKVAAMLERSNDTISNIAYDCEFKTLAHMSRIFKLRYGVSPSEFRLNLADKV